MRDRHSVYVLIRGTGTLLEGQALYSTLRGTGTLLALLVPVLIAPSINPLPSPTITADKQNTTRHSQLVGIQQFQL